MLIDPGLEARGVFGSDEPLLHFLRFLLNIHLPDALQRTLPPWQGFFLRTEPLAAEVLRQHIESVPGILNWE